MRRRTFLIRSKQKQPTRLFSLYCKIWERSGVSLWKTSFFSIRQRVLSIGAITRSGCWTCTIAIPRWWLPVWANLSKMLKRSISKINFRIWTGIWEDLRGWKSWNWLETMLTCQKFSKVCNRHTTLFTWPWLCNSDRVQLSLTGCWRTWLFWNSSISILTWKRCE